MTQTFTRSEKNSYIGVKRVFAYKMTRAEYNDLRNWELPDDENGADDGYLVEYVDGGGANTDLFDGYISWSPTEVFENAYRQSKGLSFSIALHAMKAGLKAQRKGWNGKGLFIQLHEPDESDLMNLPFLYMEYPKDSINTPGARVPWLASQTDLLAEDWEIYMEVRIHG